MLVTPTGDRLWRFRYRHRGVEKLLALGQYPDVTLKRAREKRDEARRVVADGVDPSAKRQAERAASADTFEAIAREWLGLQSKVLAADTLEILGTRLQSFLYPYVGSRPVKEITAQELLAALRRTEARGSIRRRIGCGRWLGGCCGLLWRPGGLSVRSALRSGLFQSTSGVLNFRQCFIDYTFRYSSALEGFRELARRLLVKFSFVAAQSFADIALEQGLVCSETAHWRNLLERFNDVNRNSHCNRRGRAIFLQALAEAFTDHREVPRVRSRAVRK
jgi:hypothetical protein